MPVRIAQARARQRWPSARAASPVIHWLSPLSSAVRPSRLAAILTRTHGRPCCMRLIQPDVELARLVFEQADVDLDARPRAAAPRRCAAGGSGSRIAATTRAMPAASSASVQGGVRPVWLQGSSVT